MNNAFLTLMRGDPDFEDADAIALLEGDFPYLEDLDNPLDFETEGIDFLG